MFLDALRKGGSIWSDGVGPLEAFSKGIRAKLRARRGDAALPGPHGSAQALIHARRRTPDQLAAELAPPDVLAGAHGEVVRRAAADRAMMRDIVSALRPVETRDDSRDRPHGRRARRPCRRARNDAPSTRRRRLRRLARRARRAHRVGLATEPETAGAGAPAVAAAAAAQLVARSARAAPIAGESARERRR